jgi:hypothetical protein
MQSNATLLGDWKPARSEKEENLERHMLVVNKAYIFECSAIHAPMLVEVVRVWPYDHDCEITRLHQIQGPTTNGVHNIANVMPGERRGII